MSGASHPDKAFATVQARAALAGVSLHRLEDDRGREIFVVSRGAMTRELPSLDAVSAWLDALIGKTA